MSPHGAQLSPDVLGLEQLQQHGVAGALEAGHQLAHPELPGVVSDDGQPLSRPQHGPQPALHCQGERVKVRAQVYVVGVLVSLQSGDQGGGEVGDVPGVGDLPHHATTQAGEHGEHAVLQLGADRLLTADEVSVNEESVQVQPGVRQDAAGVVDHGDRFLEAGGQARVIVMEY